MIEIFEYTLQTIENVLHNTRNFNKTGDVSFISTSSKEIKPKTLFIPLKGERDGHQFIKDAIKNGAIAFLYEKKNPFLSQLTKEELNMGIEVKNTLYSLGQLAGFHRSRFLPFVICITGSSGKTTTKDIIGKCVAYLGGEALVITEKNYNNEIGLPFTLFKINNKTKVCVLELGMNHRYEISRMVRVAIPSTVMITNVGPCHIENLGSLKEIARAKAEIIEGNKNMEIFIPDDIVYKEIFVEKAKKYGGTLNHFSLKKSKNLKIISKNQNGFKLNLMGTEIEWNLPVPKILENLAGILDLLEIHNFSRNEITEGLKFFEANNKRNVLIDKGIKILDDTYNANPDSMKSSLDSLIQVAGLNRTFAVLGDMKELGTFSKRFHKEIGYYAVKNNINGLISFGEDSYYITNEFRKEGLMFSHFKNEESALNEIITLLKSWMREGDVVLFKGSRSMKMERIVEKFLDALGSK